MDSKEIKSLSNDQLLKVGNEYFEKVQKSKDVKGVRLVEERRKTAAILYEIDKELIARGYADYVPVVEIYQERLRKEKEAISTAGWTYLAIGIVISILTGMIIYGGFYTTIIFYICGLGLLLIPIGIFNFFRKPKTYYGS